MTERSRTYWSGGRSFDMRHVAGPVYLIVDGARVPHQAVWIQPVRRPPRGRRANRRAARSGGARLRVRLHDPRAGAARPRPAVGQARAGHRQPRPRHVVPPQPRRRPRRLGALRCRKRSPPRPAAASPPAASSPATDRHLATVVQEGMIRVQLTAGGPSPGEPERNRRTSMHLSPSPIATRSRVTACPGRAVAGARVHDRGPAVPRPAECADRARRRSRSRPSAPTVRPCARLDGDVLDATATCGGGPTRSPGFSSRTSAWFPATGCCCARRTTRGRSPPGSG